MEMSHTVSDGTCNVTLRGKFTFNDHPEFRGLLTQIEEGNATRFVLNLSQVEFIDSAALGMLLLALDATEKHQKKLLLRGAEGQVRKMFEMANFHTLFKME
ncbi:MAG: STAS domain-containing protein [Leptolyngbyaceae bacterium]|nr:STAS domain-containing protein [Leptolyngbyaceae bacterium]